MRAGVHNTEGLSKREEEFQGGIISRKQEREQNYFDCMGGGIRKGKNGM